MRAEGESGVTSQVLDRVVEWTTVSFTLTNNRLEMCLLGCVELHFLKKILIYLFDPSCGMWDLVFPDRGSNPGSLRWEGGPPRKSL